MTAEKCDAQLLLEGVYNPILFMSHWPKLVSQLPKAFCRRQKCVDDMLIDRTSGGFDSLLSNMLENVTGIGTAVWGAKEYYTDRGLEDVPEMGLALMAATRPPQHLLNNDPSQTVYYEQRRPRWLYPTRSL